MKHLKFVFRTLCLVLALLLSLALLISCTDDTSREDEQQPGEDEELDQRRQLLRSAGKLTQAIQAAEFALNGDEDQPGACGLIADAEGEVRSAARYSVQMDELAEKEGEPWVVVPCEEE